MTLAQGFKNPENFNPNKKVAPHIQALIPQNMNHDGDIADSTFKMSKEKIGQGSSITDKDLPHFYTSFMQETNPKKKKKFSTFGELQQNDSNTLLNIINPLKTPNLFLGQLAPKGLETSRAQTPLIAETIKMKNKVPCSKKKSSQRECILLDSTTTASEKYASPSPIRSGVEEKISHSGRLDLTINANGNEKDKLLKKNNRVEQKRYLINYNETVNLTKPTEIEIEDLSESNCSEEQKVPDPENDLRKQIESIQAQLDILKSNKSKKKNQSNGNIFKKPSKNKNKGNTPNSISARQKTSIQIENISDSAGSKNDNHEESGSVVSSSSVEHEAAQKASSKKDKMRRTTPKKKINQGNISHQSSNLKQQRYYDLDEEAVIEEEDPMVLVKFKGQFKKIRKSKYLKIKKRLIERKKQKKRRRNQKIKNSKKFGNRSKEKHDSGTTLSLDYESDDVENSSFDNGDIQQFWVA